MFCENCGKPVPDDSKFCAGCGKETQASAAPAPAPAVVAAAAPVPIQDDDRKKKGGGFWTSAGGVVVIVALALIVLGSLGLGAYFIINGGNNAVDAETIKVWDEYESLATQGTPEIKTLNMDANALTQTQADLKKTQERVTSLEKVLKETGGTSNRRSGKPTTTIRDKKAEEMAEAIDAYRKFIETMGQLMGALNGANLLDPNVVATLNGILTELQKLGANVEALNGKFLAGNTKVKAPDFKPPILAAPKTLVSEVQKKVNETQAAEKARLEQETAAAAARQAELDRQAAAAAEEAAANEQQDSGYT